MPGQVLKALQQMHCFDGVISMAGVRVLTFSVN